MIQGEEISGSEASGSEEMDEGDDIGAEAGDSHRRRRGKNMSSVHADLRVLSERKHGCFQISCFKHRADEWLNTHLDSL